MKSKKRLVISMVVLTLVTVVCLVAGALSVVAGGVQALQETDLPEMLTKIETFLCSVIEDGTVTYNDDYDVEPYSFDVYDFDTIIIENVAYNIELTGGEYSEVTSDGTGKVQYTGKYPSQFDKLEFVKISEDGKTLTVSTQTAVGVVSANAGKLTITVPSGFNGEIIIKDCAGEIEVENIVADKLTFDSVAGDINGEACAVSHVAFEALVGDVDYKGDFVSFEVSACLGDFDLETYTNLEKSCMISDCLGDFEITLNEGTVIDVIKNDNLAEINIDVDYSSSGIYVGIENCLGSIHFDYD